MKIIVTGGVGFIGTNLCMSALERGYEVIALDNLSRKGSEVNAHVLESAGVSVIKSDIRDFDATFTLLKKHRDCSAIVHLAGQVAVTTSVRDPRGDFEANAIGSFNILEAARLLQLDVPILYSSTNKVYGELEKLRIHENETRCFFADLPSGIAEDHPLDFHSPYGCSKGCADQYFRDYARIFGLKTIVMRQSCIYGYHQFGIEDQGWIAWFLIASHFGLPITIYGNGKQLRDVLFIDDLIQAYWSALGSAHITAGQVYNIGGGSMQLSLLECIEEIQVLQKKRVFIRYAKARPGDQKVYVSDIKKAFHDFHWRPSVSPKEGIAALLEWVRSHQRIFHEANIVPEAVPV